MTTALSILAPSRPEREIVELYEDVNPIRSSNVSDVPDSFLFASPFVVYPQIPWAELEK